MDLKNKRKHYVKIDRDTTNEQVLALLDVVESDEENKIDNCMIDFDTKFIMEEEIAEEKRENDSNDGGDLLVPDSNVHIVSAENGEISKKKFHHLLGRKEQTHMKGESAH